MNISNIDLNLFRVLHAVIQEKNATRAAKRLHVTQSAVSNSLSRLRYLLKDPLVVRSRMGLAPTARALELAPMLEAAMLQLQLALERQDPELPSECARQFTLACADSQQVCDVPRIAEAMARQMPRARLHIVSIDYLLSHDGLAQGSVDLAIGPRAAGPGLFSAELYREDPVVAVRRNHPRVRQPMTRELFNSLQHVDTLIALGRAGVGHSLAEKFFRKSGLVRNVALAVPSFTAAAMATLHTDYAACLPRRIALALAEYLPLKILELPVRGPGIPLNLLWHARTQMDSSAEHLRQLIRSTLKND